MSSIDCIMLRRCLKEMRFEPLPPLAPPAIADGEKCFDTATSVTSYYRVTGERSRLAFEISRCALPLPRLPRASV